MQFPPFLKKLTYGLFALCWAVACQNPAEDQAQLKPSAPADSLAGIEPSTQTMSRLDSLTLALKENPQDLALLVDRAQYYMAQGNKRAALFDLQKALSVDSNSAPVLHTLGEYRMLLNQSRTAKESWARCIEQNPQNITCRLSLAKLYFTVQEYDKALELINAIIDIDAYTPEAYFYKGLILRNKYQDTTQALQYFQQAVELKQDYTDAMDMIGVMLTEKGDTLAPYYFKRVLTYEPNRADIYYKLGVYYMNQDDLNKAIEHYTKATQLNPRDADSYYNLGYMFIQLKEFQDARNYFSKAIQSQPNSYKAYYGRGYAHEMLGDVINAKKDYRKALENLPMYKPAREALQRLNSES